MSTKKTAVSETDTATKTETKTEVKEETKEDVKSAEAEAREEAKEDVENAEAEAKKEPVIYLGPDIKGIASHRDVFSDGVGSFFEKKIEEIPVLKNLLFPISEGGKKLAELKNGGAVERLYQAAKDQLEKKGEADG